MTNVRILLRILSNLKYAILTLVTSFVVFSFAVWTPNASLIITVITSTGVSVLDKLGLLVSLYGSIVTNFTVFSATYTTLIAFLFGINISVMFFYISKMRKVARGVGTSGVAGIGGIVAGALGIGCASCGTFVLTSILGIFGAAGALTFLPLGGAEFGIIGVVLLVYGIYYLLNKLQQPNVCI